MYLSNVGFISSPAPDLDFVRLRVAQRNRPESNRIGPTIVADMPLLYVGGRVVPFADELPHL